MFELTAANAADYLGYPCRATFLGGGVSNTVLLIETDSQRFILKQSLGKLRVEQDWFSDRRRIFRESSSMRQLAALLPAGSVPAILFEDPGNFLFAMEAAPPEAEPWKDKLLRGEIEPTTAESAARLLGAMIAHSWRTSPNAAGFVSEFGDQTIFDELRIDPYYRATQSTIPNARVSSFFRTLIQDSAARRYSLVHGDFSPKNLMVAKDPASVMAIDFEVIHYGDPSFDSAFLINHLLLKSRYRPEHRGRYLAAAARFWDTLLPLIPEDRSWFEPATLQHLGALMLARIDGKSPAEYIRTPELKDEIRALAHRIIGGEFPTIASILSR